jgi:hypothetical protein
MKSMIKIIATAFLGVAMLACKNKDCVKPITNNCSGIAGNTITVKVEEAVCGYGVWGGLWLKPVNPKNGNAIDWLQPYSLENGINFTPKKGETLTITYKEAAKDSRYDGLAICLAFPGKSTPIHILCIQSDTTQTNVSTSITKKLKVNFTCSGIGVFGDKWLYDAETNTYLQPCKWIGKAAAPSFEAMNANDMYEVTYTLSSSKECQDNFNTNPVKLCFAAPPKATPIDIWVMSKVN